MTKDEFDEHWPLYPSDGSGRQLLDLVAECNVDKLFKLQWDPKSEFLVCLPLHHREYRLIAYIVAQGLPSLLCSTFVAECRSALFRPNIGMFEAHA